MAKTKPEQVAVDEVADDDTIPSIVELDENLADIEAPPMLPRNRYLATIVAVEEKTSGKGNRYYSQLLKIGPEVFPHDFPDDVYPEGLDLYYNMIVKPKTQRQKFAVKQWLTILGLDTNTSRFNPSDWVGKEVMVTVGWGTYQGRTREEIASVQRVD